VGRRSTIRAVLVVGLLAGTLAALPASPAAAEPATSPAFPVGAATSWYTGFAFDTCEAPSTSAMAAWRSSYGAVGVYIGGRNRACKTQANLSSSWMGTIYGQGWKAIPIYVGLQAPCADSRTTTKMSQAQASAKEQGQIEAADAVGQAGRYGLRPGSAIYNDLENYARGDVGCRAVVLQYLSGWTGELHRHGFVAGVYVNLSSGAPDLSAFYTSTAFARPDAIWAARYDGSTSLNLSGIPGTQWSSHQRAKQYVADLRESHGGVTLTVDRNYVDAPVGSVALGYAVTAQHGLNARSGPSTSYPVVKGYARGDALPVMCQTPGALIATSPVWDRLADGSYVTDAYVSTPSTTGYSVPLPRCTYPYQVSALPSLRKRKLPSVTAGWAGSIDDGGLAWVICQTSGSKVGSTVVWDKLIDGAYVSDWFVATSGRTSWTRPVTHC
jgi:Domain of unknown function (DUF1906)